MDVGSLDDIVDKVKPACTALGAQSGSAEDAFHCASGSSAMGFNAAMASLFIALYVAFWLRLVWSTYKKLNAKGSDVDVDYFLKIIIAPAFVFLFLLVFIGSTILGL